MRCGRGMANGIRIRGLSGDVSNVSVQSNVNRTWALLGKKWAGLRWKVHELSLQRDELLVLKCQGSHCVLELEALGNEHGDTIVQEDVSRYRLGLRDPRRYTMHPGQALCLTTPTIKHPYHTLGPIIET
jgi:hypothetical protein